MADAGAKVLRGLLDVFILEALEREPKHGYALLREMAAAFGTEPNRNRLYPLLGRMVRDGLIAERADAGAGRTLYALTEAGRDALLQYRTLPREFQERLARVWGVDPPRAPPAPPAPGAATAAPASVRVPIASRAPDDGTVPYPCEDARVTLEKNARTGDLAVKLTGCPMGAYDYCPLCPVYKSVEGLRKLTFS